jgi:hypothetical protein
LLHRARQAGWDGGKSAIYALAQTLRTRVVTPLVRFEGLPGEFSQQDFGEVRPQLWIHDVERLHELLQTHGDAALRAALERGLAEQAPVMIAPDHDLDALFERLHLAYRWWDNELSPLRAADTDWLAWTAGPGPVPPAVSFRLTLTWRSKKQLDRRETDSLVEQC